MARTKAAPNSVRLLVPPAADAPGVLLVKVTPKGRRQETAVYHVWKRGPDVYEVQKLGSNRPRYTTRTGRRPDCTCDARRGNRGLCRHVRFLRAIESRR